MSKPVARPNDGNAFSILGAVGVTLKKAGYSKEEIDKIRKEAMSGDYDHLLQTVSKYVDLE